MGSPSIIGNRTTNNSRTRLSESKCIPAGRVLLLRIVKQVTELLTQSKTLRLHVEVIEQKVAEWLPNENPKNVVTVLISRGRFSEVFGYNDDAKELYLDIGQETT